MKERRTMGTLTSALGSKRVVIAVVAAVAMIVGVMSIGTAVTSYRKTPSVPGGQPVPGNPFMSIRSGRHAVEGAAAFQPDAAVAGVATGQNGMGASDFSPISTSSYTPPAGNPTASRSTDNPPTASAEVLFNKPLQPVLDTVMPLAKPLTTPPVENLLNDMTSELPTQVEVGSLQIKLPHLGL